MREKPDFKTIHLSRDCKHCDGLGVASYDKSRECYQCQGAKQFPALDIDAIVAGIMTVRGKRRFRKSMTSPLRKDGVNAARSYYVWRLARFHGGADVTMPMVADLCVSGDPFQPELDAIAELVAKKVFGTDMASAYRWAGAMGYNVPHVEGLPASAYSGGPVTDGNDPETEIMLTMEGKE